MRRFLVIGFHGVQPLDFVLNLIDTVAPRLVFSVQFNGVVRIGLACFLVLGVLLCLVVVAVKLRLKCQLLAVQSIFLLDDF